VADEKHSWWLGNRVYIATTAAQGCFLGVALSRTADTEGLTKAYGVFATEAQALQPGYCPKTVNTDGWEQTQSAWKTLFPGVSIILCFLHAILGIQKCLRRAPEPWAVLRQKLWHAYHSHNPRQMAQRLRRTREWVMAHIAVASVQLKMQGMAAKASRFSAAFSHREAYRTSNELDRLMNIQDRLLYSMQYFHGTHASAAQAVRSMALLWNFHPYGRKAQVKKPYCASPFEDLNGFRYHDNWLRNFLIASSLNGRNTAKPSKLKTR
jgi:hypothetical protein